MGVGRIFARRGALWDFSKIFLGDAKSGKICILSFKTTKKNFLLKFSISRGFQDPPRPPSDAHVRGRNMASIHNWDKLSNEC